MGGPAGVSCACTTRAVQQMGLLCLRAQGLQRRSPNSFETVGIHSFQHVAQSSCMVARSLFLSSLALFWIRGLCQPQQQQLEPSRTTLTFRCVYKGMLLKRLAFLEQGDC